MKNEVTATGLPLHRATRALVVDDSPVLLHAICCLLEHHKLFRVVGRGSNGIDTLDLVSELRPDLVLIDADMPGMSGLQTAMVLSQVRPEVAIVVMAMEVTPALSRAAKACGAQALIHKPRFLRELRELSRMWALTEAARVRAVKLVHENGRKALGNPAL